MRCFCCESGRLEENGKRAEIQKWEKLARNGEKMAQKWDLGSFFYFFAIFGPFFPHFGPRAIFYFLANFSPFLDFGPFSILYYTRRPDSQCFCAFQVCGSVLSLSGGYLRIGALVASVSRHSIARTTF